MKDSNYSYIAEYRLEYARLLEFGGSTNEGSIRGAFERCLKKYCHEHNLELIPELAIDKNIPDGTIRDKMRLDYGYWEAKDIADNLDNEISKKLARAYPTNNILFENGKTAVLIQNKVEIMRADMTNDSLLDEITSTFLSYRPPQIKTFYKAIERFQKDLPVILKTMREMIEQAQEKPDFIKEFESFLEVCKHTINPNFEMADVREMLIQHILTRDIFLRVFKEEGFHTENNIATHLEQLQNVFMTRKARAEMLASIAHYYDAITRAAMDIGNHREKQNFLKALYENFYHAYNPKAADRLGVVYTPDEIVRFMVRMTDNLTHRCFGRRLYDENVQILDPAAGTGTFITELIDFFPKKHLQQKYENELHANEVGILPYYIANLNIEHTYMAKMGEYLEFPGICFMDTLDNTDFEGAKGQSTLLGAWSKENIKRINLQNKQKISVIIGNPPYNANQKNENENNKNRQYPAVDERVKKTYVDESSAQKTKLYDMYPRFIRWASDRIGDNGILAFVTNSSFIDAHSYDGFRKTVAKEFNELWIFNMKGASRNINKKQAQQEGGNIFNVRVGIAIWFFVKQKDKSGSDIFYQAVSDEINTADKLSFLAKQTELSPDDFFHIVPDKKGNWINQTNGDFGKLHVLANKQGKISRNNHLQAVFKLFSLGVVSNRDNWVYDFDSKNLSLKMQFLIDIYEKERKYQRDVTGVNSRELSDEIKWTRDLKKQLSKNSKNKFSTTCIRPVLYRPFIKKQMYYSQPLNEMLYQMPHIFPTGAAGENTVICFNVNHRSFYTLAADSTVDLHFTGDSQCLPLYRYQEGEKVPNITSWAIEKFHSRYKDKKISAEDIFHYIYAVLHNPAYLRKYHQELLHEFPRLPFYNNFTQWMTWGKELMHLHINYEKIKPHKLIRCNEKNVHHIIPKLKADKENGIIIIDNQTKLSNIPLTAWEYQLGNRSALEWVLDQYKEKNIKDSTVAEKFNNYRFVNYKESVIVLLERITTVSIETIKIINAMEKSESRHPK